MMKVIDGGGDCGGGSSGDGDAAGGGQSLPKLL